MLIQNRIESIDLLKGIAILLVVMGHLIQYNTLLSQDNLIFKLIYSFHMELFMFLSGYIALKTININSSKDAFNHIYKKSVALLIPFFSWGILVKGYLFTNWNTFNITKQTIDLLEDPTIGLWFLWFLFLFMVLFLLFFVIQRIINKKQKIWVSIIIIVLIFSILIPCRLYSQITYISFLMHHYIFFFSGVIFSKYSKLNSLLLSKTLASLSAIFFLSLSSFNMYISNIRVIDILLSFAAIHSIYYLVNNIKWNEFIKRQILLWGKNSLVIYVLQSLFINLNLMINLNQSTLIIVSFIASIPIIYISILIGNIAEGIPILNVFFFGKLTKKKQLTT